LYYYRFLRPKADKNHPSEIDGDIEFYTSVECGTNLDFEWNTPVQERVKSGQDVQLLFGMESLEDAVKVMSCFNSYNRVLARFELENIDVNYSIHLDEQVNEAVGSKYIMADYHGEKISIPSGRVQILSNLGWVAKSEANHVLVEIAALEKSEYEQRIANV